MCSSVLETENEQLKKLGKEYQGSYYIFALDGSPECKLHKDKAVLAKYEEIMAKAAAEAAERYSGFSQHITLIKKFEPRTLLGTAFLAFS